MNRCFRQLLWVAAVSGCLAFGLHATAKAQSPLFPNNSAVTYNPYGQANSPTYNRVYRQPFPYKPLPSAYTRPLPGPNYGYRQSNYPTTPGYGGSMSIRGYGAPNSPLP